MKNIPIVLLTLLLLPAVLSAKKTDTSKITVAAYYFPNYHTDDARNIQNKGAGWSEWELVKAAQPRFPGHDQPKVPRWGFTDEKDPKVMKQKIKAASDYGVDCFIFDWYMYEDGPFLNRCIDEGFLRAKNVDKIKFALMWANHDWVEIHPYTRGTKQKLLYPGKVSSERFEEIGDELIATYFSKPNYWKIDGKPYFSVYDIQKFIEGFGSIEATKTAMERLNQKAIAAGLKGIHWNMVAWGRPILPVEKVPANVPELMKLLADPNGPRILNINCWNEWTEGSYLEPDTKNKFGYLEAVKNVFKK